MSLRWIFLAKKELDGLPIRLFIWFPILEMTIFALVYLNARQRQAQR